MWLYQAAQERTVSERTNSERLREDHRFPVLNPVVTLAIVTFGFGAVLLHGCAGSDGAQRASACDRAKRSAATHWKKVAGAWQAAEQGWSQPAVASAVKRRVRAKALDSAGAPDEARIQTELSAFTARQKVRVEQARQAARAAAKAAELSLGTRLQLAAGSREGYRASREPRDEVALKHLWMGTGAVVQAKQQTSAAQNLATEANAAAQAAIKACRKK